MLELWHLFVYSALWGIPFGGMTVYAYRAFTKEGRTIPQFFWYGVVMTTLGILVAILDSFSVFETGWDSFWKYSRLVVLFLLGGGLFTYGFSYLSLEGEKIHKDFFSRVRNAGIYLMTMPLLFLIVWLR